MTIKKYFFFKKTCQKNLPTKVVEKICQHKMASGCMLLTMKSMFQTTCCNEKRPEAIIECPEQCFLRPDLKFFLEFQKKKSFTIFVTLKMNIEKYFFQKKTCQKNLPTKFVEKICQHKMASRCMPLTMKSRCQNTCFNEKRPELAQETSRTMVFKAISRNFLEF